MHHSYKDQIEKALGKNPSDLLSHEINNPLAFVAANLNALSHNLNDLFDLLESYSQEISQTKSNSKSEAMAVEYDMKNLKSETLVLLDECFTEIHRVKLLVQKLKANQDFGVSNEPLALG